jgi:hypothetical protein
MTRFALVKRLLLVALGVAALLGVSAYCVSGLPPWVRPPAMVVSAYVVMSLGLFSAANLIIRNLALYIGPIGSLVAVPCGIGILAMGSVTFHPRFRDGNNLEQIMRIIAMGYGAAREGFIATVVVVLVV